jgi:HD-GYP domain-containing protein (c-di-GMP phosphodiesterase class II)
MSHDEAVTELHRNGGGQFDPQVVDAFIDTFRESDTVAFPVLARPV